MVPFQQYVLKHVEQVFGTVVFVRSKLRLNIAQARQAGQLESTVPFPSVATSYPFSMMALRSLVLYCRSNVDTLDGYIYGAFGI